MPKKPPHLPLLSEMKELFDDLNKHEFVNYNQIDFYTQEIKVIFEIDESLAHQYAVALHNISKPGQI